MKNNNKSERPQPFPFDPTEKARFLKTCNPAKTLEDLLSSFEESADVYYADKDKENERIKSMKIAARNLYNFSTGLLLGLKLKG